MGAFELAACEIEVKRCERLYKGFNEAVPFLKAVCSSAGNYFKENAVKPVAFFDAEESEQKIRDGVSIGLNPSLETKEFVGLLRAISKAISKANPKLKGMVRELSNKSDFLTDSYPQNISKDNVIEFRDSLVKEKILGKDLATFLFSFLLSSFYRQQLKTIIEVLRTDLWEGGNCPTCGEKPHFGALRKEDGAKQLECWLCGSEWVHTRIKCPYCSNDDHEKLGYFTVEDSEVCRVSFCQSCNNYYKVFDLRKLSEEGGFILAIHNLATLTYDLLAVKEGFSPGSGLEWVNENEVFNRQD